MHSEDLGAWKHEHTFGQEKKRHRHEHVEVVVHLFKPGQLDFEDEVVGVRAGDDEIDTAVPSHIRQRAGNTHHRRDANSARDQDDVVGVFTREDEAPTRRLHLQGVSDGELVMEVP